MSIIKSKPSVLKKKNVKIGIVQSLYNSEITTSLLQSCTKELKRAGVSEKNIKLLTVPGAFEIPFACQKLAKSKKFDAVISLGAIIKGQTPHFDFIASSVADGIMEISLKYDLPVVFGVLTTNTLAQAKDRIAGGKRGDKGLEAAQTVVHMLNN